MENAFNNRTRLRLLGIGHFIVSLVLLPLSAFFTIILAPLLLLGPLWLFLLGLWLWRPSPRLLTPLRITHLILAPLGLLLCGYGVFALQAARRSAEGGGGLMGGFGIIPILMGLLAGGLATATLYLVFREEFSQRSENHTDTGADLGAALEQKTDE